MDAHRETASGVRVRGNRAPAHVYAHAAGRALLIALAVTLPFELKTPIAHVGPIAITNTELVLYLVVGCWIVWLAMAKDAVVTNPSRTLWWPVAGIVAAMAISAVAAPVGRDQAIKFVLRSTGGCLLALAAMDVIRSWRDARLVVLALSAGAAVSAVAGVLEVEFPAVQTWLRSFKTQPTFASGFLRASGTFQYANTAAMYWEACLPLLVGTAVSMRDETTRKAGRALMLIMVCVVCTALVASASRAGLMGAALSLAALAAFAGRRVPAMRTAALATLAILLLMFVAQGARTGLLALRLRSSDASQWHRAAWLETPDTVTLEEGTLIRVPLRIKNVGVLPWTATGEQPVNVSYHWVRGRDAYLVFDGARTPLPHDVAPGEEVSVNALVFGNVPTGSHSLQWDLVREGVTWFGSEGGPVAVSSARLLPSTGRRVSPPDLARLKMRPEVRPPRRVLWRAALQMWRDHPLTGVGADNFRHMYGPYAALPIFDDRITANSLVFEVLATLGIFGLAAWSWLLWVICRRAATWWRATTLDLRAAVGLSLGAALLAFFLHGIVDYFLEFTPTYGLFWLLIGMATRVWSIAAEAKAT
jgi:O-antigen ligase